MLFRVICIFNMKQKIVLAFVLFLLFCIFIKYRIIKTETIQLPDLLIISATFYNKSEVYPENSVTILFNAFQNFSTQLFCISKNGNKQILISPLNLTNEITSFRTCKMRIFIQNCLTVTNFLYFGISDKDSVNSEISIPIRIALKEKLDVVSCVSPLFFNEQWHINMLSIEYYANFGVTKQVYYYMSILENGYFLLQEYEKLGIIALHPWSVPNISEFRTELDFRNQGTAHNDCYLLYREAADFIIVHDPDDLLMIKDMKNFWRSFASFLFLNSNIANILFQRFNTFVNFGSTLKDNFETETFSNILISDQKVWRKSVYFPKGVENINNHDATHFYKNFSAKFFDDKNGFFMHVRNISFGFKTTKTLFSQKVYQPMSKFLNIIDFKKVEESYKNRIHEFLKNESLQNLTMTKYYRNFIDDCYEKVYYHNESNPSKKCPSHYFCKMPEYSGLKCVHSNHKIISKSFETIKIHFLINSNVIKSLNGCFFN